MYKNLVGLAKECLSRRVMITVGANDRYRMSDIRWIMEGGDSNHYF
jgi:hypothetical protein